MIAVLSRSLDIKDQEEDNGLKYSEVGQGGSFMSSEAGDSGSWNREATKSIPNPDCSPARIRSQF
jgi:hypothetical protein